PGSCQGVPLPLPEREPRDKRPVLKKKALTRARSVSHSRDSSTSVKTLNNRKTPMTSSKIVRFLSCAFLAGAFATVAHGQATRTWVSGVGDDVNPCSRTAPCKTFAGAISKTAEGGEIDPLDPAGYGTVTITKAMTIDGGTGSGWGSILASGVASAVNVNITTG